MNYLRDIPDYVGRLLWRMDTASGIVVGIIFFFVAPTLGLSDRLSFIITAGIIVLSALEAGYGLYRHERETRSRLEQDVRITATLASFSGNVPDPGPGKSSIKVQVHWEIWVREDVSTDKLALNMIYSYDKPRWKFWKRTRFPQMGIPPDGADSTQYRKRILADQLQPFKGSASFEYVADTSHGDDPRWEIELVIVMGVPAKEYRIPVSLYEAQREMNMRGTYPPL